MTTLRQTNNKLDDVSSCLDTNIELNPTHCKPQSQWRCLKPGYVEGCKERAKNNPMLIK